MTIATSATSARTRWWWLPYLYLLRVQLIVAAIFVVGPFLALRSSLLNGLFDLDYESPALSGVAMAIVSLASFLTAWTLLASSVTTLLSAHDRFDTEKVHWVRFPIRWPEREAFGVLALVVIGCAFTHSWEASGVDRRYLFVGALMGMGTAIMVLLIANKMAASLYGDIYNANVHRLDVRVFRWLIRQVDRDNVREGFLNTETKRIERWHVLTWVVFLASLTFYIAIGLYKSFYLGFASTVSTLAYTLLLLILLCWFLAGLAFFFDRYRVPILALVVGSLTVVGFVPFPGNDHTFVTWSASEDRSASPADVLKIGEHRPILIAATGGGIQAAAWTAQVLTGIDTALGRELGDRYVRSIRLMSTVSGGGVGAMYFAQRYRPKPNGEMFFAHDELDAIVKEATTSSLDDVAWGVVYPDLIGLLFPPVRIWLGDRAQAMEKAWTRTTRVDQNSVGALLGQWRSQVWSAQRPANIFNATIVDSGERLALGTTRLGFHIQRGLRNYEDIYKTRDVQIVTAARLAASFTYVSPAARADRGEPYHVVDGGYYDDYGVTTLIEWLDEALEGLGRPEDGGPVDRVLVIQLRSSPADADPKATGDTGAFYQTAAPVQTLLNVRTTGQRSHNDEEFARLQRLWRGRGVEIDNVIFRYCGEHPPLSWHLTGRDKQRVKDSWAAAENGPGMTAIRKFFANEPIAPENEEFPFDAPLTPCATTQ